MALRVQLASGAEALDRSGRSDEQCQRERTKKERVVLVPRPDEPAEEAWTDELVVGKRTGHHEAVDRRRGKEDRRQGANPRDRAMSLPHRCSGAGIPGSSRRARASACRPRPGLRCVVGHRQLRGDFSLSGIAPEALLGCGNEPGGFVAGKQHLPEPDAPIRGRGRLTQERFPRGCFLVRAAKRCVGARHLAIEKEFGRVGFAAAAEESSARRLDAPRQSARPCGEVRSRPAQRRCNSEHPATRGRGAAPCPPGRAAPVDGSTTNASARRSRS